MLTRKMIFRSVIAGLGIGVCSFMTAGFYMTRSHSWGIMASSLAPEAEASAPIPARRIVLHGIYFAGKSNIIEKASQPVLDYAARILKRHPDTIVYIARSGRKHPARKSEPEPDLLLTNPRLQAVESYIERKGVSANRLVLVEPGKKRHRLHSAAGADREIEMVELDFVPATRE